MYSFFSPFPYVRILIFWVFGILLAAYCPIFLWPILAGGGLCLCIFQRDLVIGLWVITLSVFRFGQVQLPSQLSSDPNPRACVFQVDGPPVEKANTWAVKGRAFALRDQGTWSAASGFWKVYVEKSAGAPKPGEIYLVTGYLNPIAQPIFPSGMDWPAYYARLGVGGQIYVKKGQIERIKAAQLPFDFLRMQHYFQRALRSALSPGVNRDVAEAMFLGVASSVDFETMQRYASLGAIHILSVSGLHVGFLYLGLGFIFGFLRRWKWVYFLVILGFLWAYAGITGFSGPVLRSAWMFSVMLGAKTFRVNHHPLNTLAFSCLVLLIWNPQFVFQAGFQLSYFAVLGLILFQRALKGLYTSAFWLVNQVWDLTCVAIAAQALTWPLVLYYFHQFPHPVYFFLLNPLLIFFSSVTLGVGFVFLALSPFGFLWLGYLLDFSFRCFHGLLFGSADYFQPAIGLLQWEFNELVGYYVLIGLLAAFWQYRRMLYLYVSLGLICIFWAGRLHREVAPGLYLTLHQGRLVGIQNAGAHAILYGQMNPAWVQSNVIPLLAAAHVQDTISRQLPDAWQYGSRLFIVARKACRPKINKVTNLIIDQSLSFQDLRWLQYWPQAHWYFVRRPSAYRMRQIRHLPSKGMTFLGEVPAVYFKKKAAFVGQPLGINLVFSRYVYARSDPRRSYAYVKILE